MSDKNKENKISSPLEDDDLCDLNLDYDAILNSIMTSVAKGMNLDLSHGKVAEVAHMARALHTGRKRIEQMASLIKVSALVNSRLHIDEKLEYILESATMVLNAEASSILLKDEHSDKLIFKTAIGEKAREVMRFSLDMGEGIAGWVAKKGEALLIPDVSKDSRYSPRISEEIRFPARSIVCVPLIVSNKLIGSLEVINRRDEKPFDRQDLKVLSAFGSQVAMSIENSFLYRQSITDDLTGLYNQRYFMDQLEIEFNRASRHNHPLSLFMIDLDDFKKFNDNFGHLEGNKLLSEVSRIIKAKLSEGNIVCRYGGEEITVILPGVSIETAKGIAGGLRAGVENIKEEEAFKGKGITCSIGISGFPHFAQNHIQLLEQADKAMYSAKAEGKNKVFTFGEEV